MPRKLALILALGLLFPARLCSQQIEIEPMAGLFFPLADRAEQPISDSVFGAGTLTVRQLASPALGARIVAWWSRSLGWEAGYFSYAFSDGEAVASLGATDVCTDVPGASCQASVWFVSSKLLYRFARASARGPRLHTGGGIAVIGHQGALWGEGDAVTDLGGVLLVGGSLDLSDRFALRVDAEGYFYSFDGAAEPIAGSPAPSASKFQTDLIVTGGLVIRVGRKQSGQ